MPLSGLWSTTLKFSVAVALVLGSLAISTWFSFYSVSALPLGNYYQESCTTGTPGHPTLTLLLVTPTAATDIAADLCQSPATQSQFSRVHISWKPRTQLSAADLINERYDVIWNRRHFLTGLMPGFEQAYDTLLHYDHYQVFWLSLQSPPILSAEYFAGKRVGLLDDPSSHTHNLLPLSSLKSVEADTHIPVYFDSAAALYNAFYDGDIDLISAGMAFPSPSPVYRTVLDKSATAATFFIRKQFDDPTLRCEITNALRRLESLWQGIETHASTAGEC